MTYDEIQTKIKNTKINDFTSAIKKYILYTLEEMLEQEREFVSNSTIDLGTDGINNLNFDRFVRLMCSNVEEKINELVYRQVSVVENNNKER